MTRRLVGLRRAVLTALCCAAVPLSAEAQVWIGSDAPRRGTVEVSGSAVWLTGQDLGSRTASLTPNPGTGVPGFDLFSSEASLEPVLGGQALVGVYLSRRLSVEGGIRYARPQIQVRLTDDFEGAPDVTASTTMTQYLFSGSVLFHFGGGAFAPFIAAGGGHLRDVHTGNETVETGAEYHGKAGVKYWLGARRQLGLRAEAGLSMIDGGFSFDEGSRIAPTAAIGLSFLF